MRNILTCLSRRPAGVFAEADRGTPPKDVFHTFVIAFTFSAARRLAGDRFFGKYNTILWLSWSTASDRRVSPCVVSIASGF
jgi:hypothetical protein